MQGHRGSTITNSNQSFSRGRLELTIASGSEPRVTAFTPDGRNAFVDLGDLSIRHLNGRLYRVEGSDRPWVAPEKRETTYEVDDGPVELEETERGIVVTQAAPLLAGIEKSLRNEFVGEAVSVEHKLTNLKVEEAPIAPRAITQLPVGGAAILPLPDLPVGSEVLHPNAEAVLRPSAGVPDTPFELRDQLVLLEAVIRFKPDDFNQYCCAGFVELETLGPVTMLQPAESTSHAETRLVFEVDPATDPCELPLAPNLDGGGAP